MHYVLTIWRVIKNALSGGGGGGGGGRVLGLPINIEDTNILQWHKKEKIIQLLNGKIVWRIKYEIIFL